MFSHFIQLWFKSCPLTSKFIKFQLIASTSCVLTSFGRTVNYHLHCRKYADNSGDNEKYSMFFSFHPAMVQVMSFDIKIHQILIESKHKQCFDLIASDKVNYHLHCRKYSDNSGHNEKYSMFFSFHPAMVQVMFFDIKIHKNSINSKHKQCFDFIASVKVHYHLKCRKYSD